MDPTPEFGQDLERTRTIASLVEQARDHIRITYGTGENDGHSPRAFHNLAHTDAAIQAATRIASLAASQDAIPSRDIPLIGLAAAYHDYNYTPGSDSEQLSADALLALMNSPAVFGQDDRQKVTQMILATKMQFDQVKGVYCQRTDLSIYGQIMADADLAHLGGSSQEFWHRYLGLMRELKANPQFTRNDLKVADLENEIRFLEANRFKTPWAAAAFDRRDANRNEVWEHLEILRARNHFE